MTMRGDQETGGLGQVVVLLTAEENFAVVDLDSLLDTVAKYVNKNLTWGEKQLIVFTAGAIIRALGHRILEQEQLEEATDGYDLSEPDSSN